MLLSIATVEEGVWMSLSDSNAFKIFSAIVKLEVTSSSSLGLRQNRWLENVRELVKHFTQVAA